MSDITYIEIDGQIWQLFADGKMTLLQQGGIIPDSVEIISLKDFHATDNAVQLPSHLLSNSSLASNMSSTSAVSSGSTLVNIFSPIGRTGDETLASAGFQTFGLPDTPATSSTQYTDELVGRIDPDASVSIVIDDDANLTDSYVNRFENLSVGFSGITANLADGWLIEILLTDSQGQTFSAQSNTFNNAWLLPSENLSALAEGPFSATATARDIYGNFVSSTSSSTKDTLAEGIEIALDTGNDTLIDLFEAPAAKLSGQFEYVQSGAEILITITDSAGTRLNFSSNLDATGNWSITADLSNLAEGQLQLHAETIDRAGNPAEIDNQIELVLSPRITLENPDSDGQFDDGVYNQFESSKQLYFGTLFNVEDGQEITVTITDAFGMLVTATTIASNNAWSADEVDTSGLADGPLTITARVSNLAGAQVDATLNRTLDQTAAITAEFVDPNSDSIYNYLEAMHASLRGVVTDIEVGQPVYISVSDGSTSIQAIGQVQSGGLWVANDIDLSAASGETLFLTINVTDKAGNPASASATIAYDPIAIISDSAFDNQDGDQDQLFNAAEVASAITLQGTTDNIENGQPLLVTISDGINPDVIVNTTVVNATGSGINTSAGEWITALNGVDISSLNDGDLEVTITGADVAGNTAIGTDVIHKDTLAAITVVFDGDGKLSVSELAEVSISGVTTDVEAGQTVNLTISGGGAADINFTASVQADGSYSSLNETPTSYDLSAFNDGSLSVSAEVTDASDNPANAINYALKDVVLDIDIDTGLNGLDIEKIKFGTPTIFRGTTDAEENQVVTLTFADGSNEFQTTASVDSSGEWATSSIAPSGLNPLLAWTFNAEVSDQAGNSAVDDTPTLDIPSGIILSESALTVAPDSEVSQLRIDIGGDSAINTAPFIFSESSRQTAFDKLTSSDGVNSDITTTVSVSGDGKTIQLIRNIDGFVVIEGVIEDTSTSVTLTLYGSIEQAGNTASIGSGILIQAIQNDVSADTSAEVVEARLNFIVRDGLTFAEDDSYQVTEDRDATGNLFDNDNRLEGPLEIKTIDYLGTIYSVAFGSPAVIIDASKGTLSVNQDGSWSFSAARNQDHSGNNPTFEFTYVAEDADGDEDFADVVLNISDGDEGYLGDIALNTSEQLLSNLPGTTATTVRIEAGSDNLAENSATFLQETIGLLAALNLTSDGEALSYAISADNKTITAMTNNGDNVFITVISDNQNTNGQDLDVTGTTTWYRPLDHDNGSGDQLKPVYLVTATDSDGTTIAPATVEVDFNDGQLLNAITTSQVALDEDDLSPTEQVGTLRVILGSDYLNAIMFNEASGQPSFTSNGETLSYTISADGLTLTGSSSEGEVIQVVLDSVPSHNSAPPYPSSVDISYTVILTRALDQPNTAGSDNAELALPFAVTFTDSDGDTATSTLNIVVNDQMAPVVTPLSLAATEIPNKDDSNLSEHDEGVISITAGGDKIVSLQYGVVDGSAVKDTSGNFITSNGVALLWRSNGDGTLDAVLNSSSGSKAGGGAMFTVTVPDSINVSAGGSTSIKVELDILGPIDHITNITDTAAIDLALNFIDSDGTASTATVSLNIDDGHDFVLYTPAALSVNEADLATGTSFASGKIFGAKGSDELTAINLALNTTGLTTSEGVAVTLSQSSDFLWTGMAGAIKVFEITADTTGNFNFELFESITHPDPAASIDTNIKQLDFSVYASDADSDDSNTVQWLIDITDDVPLEPIYDSNNTLVIEEYSTNSGNLLSGNNLITDGNFGEDSGRIISVNYKSTDYAIPDGGSIDITLSEGTLLNYGTLSLQSNGNYTFVTDRVFNLLDTDFSDHLLFDMVDLDNDTIKNVRFNFDVKDSIGSIYVTPRTTDEDIPFTVALTGNAGDIDNGEEIQLFTFDNVQLFGASLTLNHPVLGLIDLPLDSNGNPFLEYINGDPNSLLKLTGSGVPGEMTANGDLIFTPALNSSNQTVNVQLDITMTVGSFTGPYDVDDTFNIKVNSVADAPQWDAAGIYTFNIQEDASNEALTPTEATLFDTDTSETLSYRIENINAGIALTNGDQTILNGTVLTASQFAGLQVSVNANLSGSFNFTAVAISTETENKDTAEIPQIFTVEVSGEADMPSLLVRNIHGTEDVPIEIKNAIEGLLADLDGSETLWFEITLPSGWAIENAQVIDEGGGVYRVSEADILAGATFNPKEDLSETTEVPSISVRAISVEATESGVAPTAGLEEAFSPSKSFTIKLKGVADDPDIGPGGNNNWTYVADNPGHIVANVDFDEDSLIALDFTAGTEDDDGSEAVSLLLSGVPAGSEFFNNAGSEIYLPVFDASAANNPVYSVTQAQLADLLFQPPQDFSGAVELTLVQINTEPDGDRAEFDLRIDFNVAPIIDTKDNQSLGANGIEDQAKPINLMPTRGDLDGSESITELTILPGFSGVLYLDGSELLVPASGLKLSTLAGGDLTALLTSDRITFQAPVDQHGFFSFDISYEVTDTNGSLSPDNVKTFNGKVDINVVARVEQNEPTTEDDTRIETSTATLNSSGGNPIDLTGQVGFFEADMDGSERLDYVLLKMPDALSWFVESTDGRQVLHDGYGNWLLPAPSTSATLMEQNLSLFDNILIHSRNVFTGILEVEARVLDGTDNAPVDDADVITAEINVAFSDPGAMTIAFDPNTLEASIADGDEDEVITLSEHINIGLRNIGDDSGTDQISFRVTPADLSSAGIAGAWLSGTGMQVHYALDGTSVIAWVFDESALTNLKIHQRDDQDFAGDISLPIMVIATDPSGDTITKNQTMSIDVLPVVDPLLSIDSNIGQEDQLFNLTFDLALGDADTEPTRGVETITQLVFSNLGGATLFDPFGHLVEAPTGTFTLSDPSKLALVFFRPPQHVDGSVSLDAAITITDITTGGSTQSNLATAVKNVVLDFELEPITDSAELCVVDSTGDEDSLISFESGFCANLIDQDGSETISVQISGVPEGAIMFAGGEALPDNGPDGGSVLDGDLSGAATYSFTVTQAQIDSLQIQPPEDFSGDLKLTLKAITNEKGTADFVTTTADFIVAVYPIADGIQILNADPSASGDEGSAITINLDAETQEVANPNETVEITVTALASSDSTALEKLNRIIADGVQSRFKDNGDGTYTAAVITNAATLASFDLLTGNLAWGQLDLQIAISSYDSNTVLGTITDNISTPEIVLLSVDIAPLPDAGMVVSRFDGLISSDGLSIPMDLSLDISNTNSHPDEIHELVIHGLPSGFNFNFGAREGGRWVVSEADIPNLELLTATNTKDFSLTLEGRSTLNDDSVTGTSINMDIKIQAAGENTLVGTEGDDRYEGGTLADTFTWSAGDQGNILFPAKDTVIDFNSSGGSYSDTESDALDLTGLLAGLSITNGTTASTVIDVTDNGANTEFSIRPDGAIGNTQKITLEGLNMSDLVANYSDESDFLQQLINNNLLVTG